MGGDMRGDRKGIQIVREEYLNVMICFGKIKKFEGNVKRRGRENGDEKR